MKKKAYEINVEDDCVKVWGNLTIEEAFDWLNYFEKKGYDQVGIGEENSTMIMYKSNFQESVSANIYNIKVQECIKAYQIIADLESLIKKLTNDEVERKKFYDKPINNENY